MQSQSIASPPSPSPFGSGSISNGWPQPPLRFRTSPNHPTQPPPQSSVGSLATPVISLATPSFSISQPNFPSFVGVGTSAASLFPGIGGGTDGGSEEEEETALTSPFWGSVSSLVQAGDVGARGGSISAGIPISHASGMASISRGLSGSTALEANAATSTFIFKNEPASPPPPSMSSSSTGGYGKSTTTTMMTTTMMTPCVPTISVTDTESEPLSLPVKRLRFAPDV